MASSLEGCKVLRGGGTLFPKVQDAANQNALRAQQGVARGSVYHHLPPHGVLLRGELQLGICGGFEDCCWGLEGVKIGDATAERHLLELEGGCGGLGTHVFSWAQEEEVCELDHV